MEINGSHKQEHAVPLQWRSTITTLIIIMMIIVLIIIIITIVEIIQCPFKMYCSIH